MSRHGILFGLVLMSAACSSGDPPETWNVPPHDAWRRSPPPETDLSGHPNSDYLPASSFVEVSADLQQEAQALLAEQTFAVLTEEQGKRFATGRLTASRADAKFVLLRGLKHQSAGAGLEGKVLSSDLRVRRRGESVIAICTGYCTRYLPTVRTAIVALLSDAPEEVYTDVQTAIVGGVSGR